MTTPSKRAFLRGAAAIAAATIPAGAALALPAVPPGSGPGADAELVALAAEIDRLCARGREIYARGFDPFEETFQRIVRDGPGPFRERAALAFAYSDKVGRDAAIEEREELDLKIDRLWIRMTTIPAATRTGRAAKVRALLTHVCPEWRGAADDLDWEIQQARALLGEFAGMSEEELAMAGEAFHVDA
jgi:hypothetical protein